MPPSSRQSHTKGRWRAVALSLFVHALIVAAAVFGWFTWKHDPPPTTLAIDATVVDERALKGANKLPEVQPEPPPEEPAPEPVPEPEPEPEPQQTPPEEQGPPAPDPEELKRKEEERLAAERAEQEKAEQQKKEQERVEAEKKEQERLEAEKKEAQKEAEKQAAAKAAAEKVAAEKAAAEKRAAEKKKADEARKAAEEKARQAAQEELRRSLEAEERGNAARNSAEANRWYASIVAKIERAWIKPPSAVPGVTCVVLVSQVPGGEVTSVRVTSCSVEDAALRESVQAAVYRASPLPTPPAGVPFERNLELTFAPDR